MANNGEGVRGAVEHAKEALVESGHAVATGAVEVKDQIAATAAIASDKAGEAVHALAAQVPSTPQEWEAVAKDVADSIRKNPRPWLIGAAVVAFLWLVGRRRAR